MVQPYYDSLVGKLIVRGKTRDHAIRRLLSAMDEMVVEGIKTTMPLQRELLQTKEFRTGKMWTSFVDKWLKDQREAE